MQCYPSYLVPIEDFDTVPLIPPPKENFTPPPMYDSNKTPSKHLYDQ